MATTLKIKSSSSPPSSVLEISTKFHHFFLVFLGLLFILLALVNSTATGDPSKPSSSSMAASTLPSHETLFSDSSAEKDPPAKTKNFRPRKRENRKSKQREFEASDHEVPSGPNPISNR